MMLIWLAFTTAVGALIGYYVPTEHHEIIGAVIGFICGLVVAAGGGEAVADGISDALDD